MKWFKLIAVNCAVLFSLFGIVFVCGEIYYRHIYDDTDSFALAKTTKKWLEKYYLLNNFGVRDDRDYFMEIEKNRTRVTFIGDSFTAGHGIENVTDRFANIIRNSKPEWEVHVFGVNGFDTGDQLKMLADLLGQGLKLEWVVLVYTLNDIADITPEWKTVIQRLYYPEKRHGFIISNSWFANTLYYRFIGTTDPDVSSYFNFVSGAYSSPLWETQKDRLRWLEQMVASNGGKLLAVTFPFMHDVDKNSYRAIHEKLNLFWLEHRVPQLDLSHCFDQYTAKQLTVNRFDAHPNEFAHSIAAKYIYGFIEDEMSRYGR